MKGSKEFRVCGDVCVCSFFAHVYAYTHAKRKIEREETISDYYTAPQKRASANSITDAKRRRRHTYNGLFFMKHD